MTNNEFNKGDKAKTFTILTGLKMILNTNKTIVKYFVFSVLVFVVSMAGAETYLSPTDVCVSSDGGTVYVAELTAGKIAVYDAASETVVQEIVLPMPNQASGVALSPDGSLLYVTVADAQGKVYVVDTATKAIVDTITVGHTAMSPVVSADGGTLYVCNRFDDTVSIVDVASKAETVVGVIREPVASAMTGDGTKLVVCNLLPRDATTDPKLSATVSIIDTSSKTVSASVRLPNGSVSVRGVCVSPDSGFAYVVHLLAKYHITPNQIERGWTYNNVLSIVDLGNLTLLSTVVLDDLDLGAGNPRDVQCSADGESLVVAHAGTHEISVIDRAGLHGAVQGREVKDTAKDFSTLVLIRKRVAMKGKGPRAIAMAGSMVYAAEYFTGSIGVVDIDAAVRARAKSIVLGSEPAMTEARQGELIYHDATLSFQNWLSCSSCHPDARNDALNWDQLNDGFGNAKQTKSHLYSHFTAPTTILGVRPNAESSVRAGLKYAYFNVLDESYGVAVDEYLKSLTPVSSPYLVDGELNAAAVRGKALFEGSAGCASCHTGPTYFTDMHKYNVGTGFGRHQDAEFDTPTLAEIWRTAPYLYRGQAGTIEEVLTTFNTGDQHGVTSNLNASQIADLAEYVLSIGTE